MCVYYVYYTIEVIKVVFNRVLPELDVESTVGKCVLDTMELLVIIGIVLDKAADTSDDDVFLLVVVVVYQTNRLF